MIEPGGGRRGNVAFYDLAKATHFSSLEDAAGYMAAVRERYEYERSLEEGTKGAVKAAHPLQDATYRWCMEYVGKYGHSPAPKQVQVDARILVVMDLDEPEGEG